jgi:hypothetical protein
MELELAYFEQVTASPALTLLRVAGAFSDGAPGPEPAILIVRSAGVERRVPALGAGQGDGVGAANGAPWRAAFGVPTELVEPGTEYLLDVGREIPLPTPHTRGEAAEPAPEERASPAPPAARSAPEPILVTPAQRGVPARDPSLRRIAGIILALVLVGFGGAWLAGAFKGTDSPPAARSAAAPPVSTPPAPTTPGHTTAASTPAAGAPIALMPVPGIGGPAQGSIALRGSRLAVHLRGLGPGTFQVWLYDTVLHSAPLGAPLHGPAATLSVALPAGGRGYRFIDVSREGDANPGHSGRSVLRVPLAALRRAGGATPAG